MNDRFKFRVWNKARQCYIEPPEATPLLQADGLLAYFTNHPEYMENYDVQFCTGLKDKNGKLIYEGDIVQIPTNWDEYGMMAGEKREIYFNEGGFRLKPKWDKNSRGNWLEDTKDLKIIGNIYENSELLQECE